MLYTLGYNDSIANIPGTSIHIYSLLLTIGLLAATFASWFKMYRRNIPTRTLEWGVLIIVFTGLIGARLWFILNHISTVKSFIDVFAVWNGGIAIQGGITVGGIVGFFIFYRASKQLNISMWVFLDCIMPNILLGQAIGRWGNFFDQQILGANVGHKFWFLPDWMNEHLHYNELDPNRDPVEVYRQPLFLYESIISLIGWFILTFFVPKAGQMFSKKPWKLFPEQFISPFKNEPIQIKDVYLPWKLIKKFHKYRLWKSQCWQTAYFDFCPERKNIKSIIKKPIKHVKITMDNGLMLKAKLNFTKLNYWFAYKFQQKSKPLFFAYNPNKYRVTHAGVTGSLYFTFYGIVRLILEPLRDPRDIMMINGVSTSMIISGIWIIFGLVLAIFAQFIAPSRFRKGEWLYEKSY